MFDVREGWEPLCKFLDLPVPDVPFPRINDAAQVAEYIDAKVVAVSRPRARPCRESIPHLVPTNEITVSYLPTGRLTVLACGPGTQGKKKWLYVAAGTGAAVALSAAIVWAL